MNHRLLAFSVVLALSASTGRAAADAPTTPETAPAPSSPARRADTSVMIETDPSTFFFGGFAAHARVVRGHFGVGAGVYALTFPGFLVDLNPNDRGAGWNVRLELGGALFGDYYFDANADGWFVGAELAVQEYRYTNDNVPGAARATNAVLMPRFGYQWRPFDAGFYVMPWAGLGVQAQIGGSRQVGDRSYDLSPIVPYAAVHVGWRF
jgi:hypothetical protein